MNRKTSARVQRLCLLACYAVPAAHADSLRLCTARADGNYHAAGEAIRSRSRPDASLLESIANAAVASLE